MAACHLHDCIGRSQFSADADCDMKIASAAELGGHRARTTHLLKKADQFISARNCATIIRIEATDAASSMEPILYWFPEYTSAPLSRTNKVLRHLLQFFEIQDVPGGDRRQRIAGKKLHASTRHVRMGR